MTQYELPSRKRKFRRPRLWGRLCVLAATMLVSSCLLFLQPVDLNPAAWLPEDASLYLAGDLAPFFPYLDRLLVDAGDELELAGHVERFAVALNGADYHAGLRLKGGTGGIGLAGMFSSALERVPPGETNVSFALWRIGADMLIGAATPRIVVATSRDPRPMEEAARRWVEGTSPVPDESRLWFLAQGALEDAAAVFYMPRPEASDLSRLSPRDLQSGPGEILVIADYAAERARRGGEESFLVSLRATAATEQQARALLTSTRLILSNVFARAELDATRLREAPVFERRGDELRIEGLALHGGELVSLIEAIREVAE